MITKNNRNSNYEWAINSKPTGENNAILSYQFNTIDDFNVTLKVNGSATFMQRVSVLSKTAIIPVKHLRSELKVFVLKRNLRISAQGSEDTNPVATKLSINGPDFSLKEGTLNPEKGYKIVLTVDEGSIYEVPIQVGDDKFENNVTLRIRIFNENGDFWTFMTVFQNVRIPSQYFPTGVEDVKRLENLFRDFNKTVSYIRAGGDTMRTFRYVGSVASMFAKHKRNESVTTEEDILKGAKYVKFYKESPTEKKYKEVLPMTTIDETFCRCAGHIFSTTFNIPLNLIDLYHVWDKFDAKNATVYGTIIALFVIYIVLAVILRREDMKDIHRWSVSFLSDHDADDSYFYKITVFTGLRRHAGTTSNIFFVLSGSQDDSRTRSLHGGVRKGLSSGSIVTFVFGTRHNLGDLEYIRIWHDSSGEGSLQDWYLNKIEITDIQTDERYEILNLIIIYQF
uniref:Polycystic kidney disease protein 1-like 2 n=1 Tax=Magallana gigas TaxID=29159 RepID=K1RVM6_MAGGI